MKIKQIRKKAMSNFEIIGYAVLAIVVLLVAIVIFVKLSSGPSSSVTKISADQTKKSDACIANPANCELFTSAPPIYRAHIEKYIETKSHLMLNI